MAQAQTAPARVDNALEAKAFEGGHLRLYEKLAKADGSVLCQARTEKIGLLRFLFRRRVPGVISPVCPCRRGDQTTAHLFHKLKEKQAAMPVQHQRSSRQLIAGKSLPGKTLSRV